MKLALLQHDTNYVKSEILIYDTNTLHLDRVMVNVLFNEIGDKLRSYAKEVNEPVYTLSTSGFRCYEWQSS